VHKDGNVTNQQTGFQRISRRLLIHETEYHPYPAILPSLLGSLCFRHPSSLNKLAPQADGSVRLLGPLQAPRLRARGPDG
jgi:hypothetical protein